MFDPMATDERAPNSEEATGLSRRTCLAAAGTLLAGCVSGDGGRAGDRENGEGAPSDGIGGGDLPEYSVDEDAQPTPMVLDAVTLTDDIEFLDGFPVELAIANIGGVDLTAQSIEVGLEYADRSGMVGGTSEPGPVSVDLPEIESGDWKTVEANLRVNIEGPWRLVTDARTHPSFGHTVDVDPQRLSPGDSLASDVGDFEITALEPTWEGALHYETEEGGVGLFEEEATGLVAAEEGDIFHIHRFAVANTSEDRSIGFGTVPVDNQFGRATISTSPGEPLSGDDMRDTLDALVVPSGDEAFGDNTIDPGETRELVAVHSVPVGAPAEASLTLSLGGDGDDVVFESTDEPPALPEFELVEATLVDDGGPDPVIEMVVENTGGGTGTFRGAAQFHASRPTASDWAFLPEGVETDLNPGERDALRIAASRGEDEFRVLPFGKTLKY